MIATKAKIGKCGATGRSGKPCGYSAGWGTDHVGTGRCKLHTGSTRNGKLAAVKEEAAEFAAANLSIADAGELDPTDNLVLSVTLAEGVMRFYREKARNGDPGAAEQYLAALDRLNRFSKAAVDGKVAERLAAVGERAGEQVALICEEALAVLVKAGVRLTNAQRTAYANAIGDGLERLEGDPLTIEAGDG
jgi:hypothetical protein